MEKEEEKKKLEDRVTGGRERERERERERKSKAEVTRGMLCNLKENHVACFHWLAQNNEKSIT